MGSKRLRGENMSPALCVGEEIGTRPSSMFVHHALGAADIQEDIKIQDTKHMALTRSRTGYDTYVCRYLLINVGSRFFSLPAVVIGGKQHARALRREKIYTYKQHQWRTERMARCGMYGEARETRDASETPPLPLPPR